MNIGDKYFRLLSSIWILGTLFGTACAQGHLKTVTDNEVSLKFQHVAKLGETKKYLINLKQIPNAPPLPTGYELFEDKAYYLKTETVDLGRPTVAFKINTNCEPIFNSIRILQLVAEDLNPKGYEWRTCTISEDNVWHFPPYTKAESGAFLPDFTSKIINCVIEDGLKPDQYFVIAMQSQPPPTKAPFTGLTTSVEGGERKPNAGNVSYDLTLINSGKQNIGELNIRSSFNSDIKSMIPDRGTCRLVPGSGDTTGVCYLGMLPLGGKIKIHFDVTLIPQKIGTGGSLIWIVDSLVKEKPEDPMWPVNIISFEPLTSGKMVNGM